MKVWKLVWKEEGTLLKAYTSFVEVGKLEDFIERYKVGSILSISITSIYGDDKKTIE